MSNKDRLIANNAKIEEIRQTLARKQVSPTDMLQARVDATNSCSYLFYNYTGKDLSFIKNLDTSNATSMVYMFGSCKQITSLDLSNINTSNVTDMQNIFAYCQSLTTLNLSGLDTSKVVIMNYMFNSCSNLTSLDLSSFDTSGATTMQYMFQACTGLTSLDLSNFNTSKVTTMGDMFNSCSNLTSLDLSSFDTSKVGSMSYMFAYCQRLTSLDLTSFDTSNVTSISSMFNACHGLKEIFGELNLIANPIVNNMFSNCTNLTNVTLKNIKGTIQLGSSTSWGTKLSDNSIINTFQELHELTGQTLTLSTTSGARTEAIYVKLIDITDDMRANDPYIDNKKPCVVCESTDEGAMTLKEYGISKGWSISY